MSASNWAVCPKCLSGAQAYRLRLSEEIAEAYGKVSRDEFRTLQDKRDAVDVNPEKFRTFREDYEIYGADKGTLVVSYGGSCEVCGLEVTFYAEKPFWPETA